VQQTTFNGAAFGPPQPDQPTDALELQVLAILQDGRVHHRQALAAEVGANVRQVRAAVSRLRVLGWPIGFGATGGYQLTWERPALEALLRKYRSQALAELRVLSRLKRMLQRWVA
jgi:biotin operon repressor